MPPIRKLGIVRSIAVTTTPAQIIGPSAQRTALLFSPPVTAGQSYTVSTDPQLAAVASGLNLTTTSGPLLITEELFGDAVKRTWFAISSSNFTIGFLETIRD